jgi:hypothetical protein
MTIPYSSPFQVTQINLQASDFHCPYCKSPGNNSSKLQEILGFVDGALGYSQYWLYCTRCENSYVVYKGGDQSIAYRDSSVPVRHPYVTIEQQRLNAEAAIKNEAAIKAEVLRREEARQLADGKALAKADADAREEAKFTAKVQAEVVKMLAKLGVKNGR